MTRWGRAADRIGNLKVMFVTGAMVPLIPLFWLVSTNLVYLVIVQVFSGLAWAGFNLCSVNYLYDATGAEDRTKYLAYFNCGNGLAAGAGALPGGLSDYPHAGFNGISGVEHLPDSGILRGATSLIFLPRLKEVRKSKHGSGRTAISTS